MVLSINTTKIIMNIPTSITDPTFIPWLHNLLEQNHISRQPVSVLTSKLRKDYTIEQLKTFIKRNGTHIPSRSSLSDLHAIILNAHLTQFNPPQLPMTQLLIDTHNAIEAQHPVEIPLSIEQQLYITQQLQQASQLPQQQLPQQQLPQQQLPQQQLPQPQLPQQQLPQPQLSQQQLSQQQLPQPQLPQYQLPQQQLPQQQLPQQQLPQQQLPQQQLPVITPNEPYKKQSIPKPVRLSVWKKYYGNSMVGSCVCCKRTLEYDDYDCSHIKPERFGGEIHIDNLMPACKSCNRSMGTMNLLQFQKFFEEKIARKPMVNATTQTDDITLTLNFGQMVIA